MNRRSCANEAGSDPDKRNIGGCSPGSSADASHQRNFGGRTVRRSPAGPCTT